MICGEILSELFYRRENEFFKGDFSSSYTFESFVSKKEMVTIPSKIKESVKIHYYYSQDIEKACVPLLDEAHQYVYQEYNQYVTQLQLLATNIYFLEMNQQTSIYAGQILNTSLQIHEADKHHRRKYFKVTFTF